MDSLYQRIGGETAVQRIVDTMYDRVLGDSSLRAFFDGVDMARQRAKFRAFIVTAIDGPGQRSGIELRATHSRVVDAGLAHTHFAVFASHLKAALASANIDNAAVSEIMERIERLERDVLGT